MTGRLDIEHGKGRGVGRDMAKKRLIEWKHKAKLSVHHVRSKTDQEKEKDICCKQKENETSHG